jgi:MFS family permease
MRAAATLFVLTGLVSATWAARIPAIQEQLGLSPGALGLAVLGLEGGAIAGLPAGGALVARRGSRAVLRLGFAGYPLALVGVALAPALGALAAALAVMAFANSLVDVAMNVQGVELERRTSRSLLSRLHAGHAFGVLAGGLGGTVAATADVPVEAHFAGVAAAGAILGQLAAGALVDEHRRADDGVRPVALQATARRDAMARGRPVGRVDRRLVLLGAVAFCAFLLDGGAYAWIAVHLRSEGAAPGLAAAGFSAFALALAVGRLAGDRLVERSGRASVVRAGGALAAGGIGVALLAPTPAVALAGWAALGAGLAPIAPAVLGASAGTSTLSAPRAIAAVTAIGYLGSFTGPPLIGALAGPVGLTAALGVMAAAALSASVLSGPALRGARRSGPPAAPSDRPASTGRSPGAWRPAAPGAAATPPAPRAACRPGQPGSSARAR